SSSAASTADPESVFTVIRFDPASMAVTSPITRSSFPAASGAWPAASATSSNAHSSAKTRILSINVWAKGMPPWLPAKWLISSCDIALYGARSCIQYQRQAERNRGNYIHRLLQPDGSRGFRDSAGPRNQRGAACQHV